MSCRKKCCWCWFVRAGAYIHHTDDGQSLCLSSNQFCTTPVQHNTLHLLTESHRVIGHFLRIFYKAIDGSTTIHPSSCSSYYSTTTTKWDLPPNTITTLLTPTCRQRQEPTKRHKKQICYSASTSTHKYFCCTATSEHQQYQQIVSCYLSHDSYEKSHQNTHNSTRTSSLRPAVLFILRQYREVISTLQGIGDDNSNDKSTI
jgi:hypothetical protein